MSVAKGILGWGIVIYSVMYLFWSATVIYGFSFGIFGLVARLAILFLVTSIAARSLAFTNWKDILSYAAGWALLAAVFDAIFLVPFAGWALYASWSVWFGYALVILFPLIATRIRRRKTESRPV